MHAKKLIFDSSKFIGAVVQDAFPKLNHISTLNYCASTNWQTDPDDQMNQLLYQHAFMSPVEETNFTHQDLPFLKKSTENEIFELLAENRFQEAFNTFKQERKIKNFEIDSYNKFLEGFSKCNFENEFLFDIYEYMEKHKIYGNQETYDILLDYLLNPLSENFKKNITDLEAKLQTIWNNAMRNHVQVSHQRYSDMLFYLLRTGKLYSGERLFNQMNKIDALTPKICEEFVLELYKNQKHSKASDYLDKFWHLIGDDNKKE